MRKETTGRPQPGREKRQPAGSAVGYATDGGGGTSNNTGDLTPIAFLGISQVTLAPNFLDLGIAGFAERSARQSGSFDHHRYHQRRLQQRDQPVGFGGALGDDGEFQSEPDPGAGRGQLDHDRHGGRRTPVGTYPLTVTGSGGGVQQNTTVTLTVTAAVQPSFILTVSPPALAVAQGSKGNSTATTTLLGGFNSAIRLSASGMPAGTTVTLTRRPFRRRGPAAR